MQNKLYSELSMILHRESLVKDNDLLIGYSEDKSALFFSKPSIVVKPRDKDEIKEVLKFAREHNFKITCWGQGTSVTGACLAFDKNTIVMSLERFNKILEIDEENLIAVVEPCVVVSDLKDAAKAKNLFYPPDPASFESSTVGGNISTGAGGPSAVKYGVTKDYITGLEVILSDGSELKLGGKIVKNSSGYNLKDIFVSSEGTLGIITKIYLKLIPEPLNRITFYTTFDNIVSLLRSVNRLLNNSILPVTIEYIDDIALHYLNKKFNLPDKEAVSALITEIEYEHNEQKIFNIERIYKILSGITGFREMFPLESPTKEREIWAARRGIGEIFRENFSKIGKADIVVPRGFIYQTIRDIKTVAKKYNILISCFGHAGDGNIHVNILSNEEIPRTIMDEIYKIVKKNEGMPSGEHGIGIYKKNILKKFVNEKELELMREIKKIFDPYNILNSGKIFDI